MKIKGLLSGSGIPREIDGHFCEGLYGNSYDHNRLILLGVFGIQLEIKF